MGQFHYQTYGLTIASEIELPEASGTEPLPEYQAKADLNIRYGRVPREVRRFRAMAGDFMVGEDEILLRVPKVGRFFMERGATILVETAPELKQEKLSVYLLGLALGAILHQRGMLLLHGGACVIGDAASGFLGHSGAGKSTISSALAVRGCPMLTDDLMAIGINGNGKPEVYPGLPTVKLWPDAADSLMPEMGAPFAQASRLKRRVHLPQSLARAPRQLRNIFLMTWSMPQTSRAACDRVNPLAAISEIRRHSFDAELIGPMGLDSRFLDQASHLIRSCAVWRLRRPRNLSAMDEVIDLIKAKSLEAAVG